MRGGRPSPASSTRRPASASPTLRRRTTPDMTTTASSSSSTRPVPAASDLTVEEQASLTAGADMWHSDRHRAARPAGLRPDRRAERGAGLPVHGRDLDLAALRHRPGLDVEPRADRAGRSPARRGGPLEGRQRAAGPHRQHPAPPARRAELRVLLRGPVPDRRDRRGLHRGRAEPGRRLRGQALRAATTRRPTAWRSTPSSTSGPGARSTSRRSKRPCAGPACGRSWPPTTGSTAIHCSQHPGLLTDLLRDEWGFDGVVVSDWFGTHSADALAAGLDLEMPGPAQRARRPPARAVEAGRVSPTDIEQAAQRMLDLIERTAPSRQPDAAGDPVAAARGRSDRPRRGDRGDRAARQRRRAPAGRDRRARPSP